MPARALRVALIAIDFEDQPFVITQPKNSDPFGNPQIDPVPRADVARFYADFWGVPSRLNRGHTIHEYWMEQSHGTIGIPKIDVFGPYRMPRKLFEYGLNEYNQQDSFRSVRGHTEGGGTAGTYLGQEPDVPPGCAGWQQTRPSRGIDLAVLRVFLIVLIVD